MSDTPKTDALVKHLAEYPGSLDTSIKSFEEADNLLDWDPGIVASILDHARQLERNFAEAMLRIETWTVLDEELRRDAKRYRWMLEHLTEIVWHLRAETVGNVRQFTIGCLDEVVDEAMKA